MLPVTTSVQPKADTHPRAGQAGYVYASNPARPNEVAVKWDSDSQVTTEQIADLRQL